MIHTIKYLIIVLLLIPIATAQSGGGGGISVPLTFTYEQCNEILDNKIEKYVELSDVYYDKVRNVDKMLFGFLIFFILFVLYLLITFGMAIQQIKDKGFKKWWRKE